MKSTLTILFFLIAIPCLIAQEGDPKPALVEGSDEAAATPPASEPESVLDPVTDAHRQSIVAFNPAEAKAFGAPAFSLRIPEALLKEHAESNIAQSHLSVLLDEGQDAVELRYDNERSQIPVIAGFFDEAKCDGVISAETYRSRPARHAALAFTIKSIPTAFGPYTTIIEHWHVTDFGEVFLKAMQFEDLETFSLNRVSVQGVLPGINRFKLRVFHRNVSGVSTLSEGVSHFVVVNEAATFDVNATHEPHTAIRNFNDLSVFEAGLSSSFEFTLTPAVDPRMATLRLLKKGSRLFAPGGLRPELRRIVGAPIQDNTLRFVTECPLVGGTSMPELSVEALGGRRYRVTLRYGLSLTSSVLPLVDDWMYRIEIRYPSQATVLQTRDLYIKADIPNVQGGTLRFGPDPQALDSVPFTQP